MTDLELLIMGVVVTFIAISGAYVAIRHRANETPVDSYKDADRNRDHYAPAPVGLSLNGVSHRERPELHQN